MRVLIPHLRNQEQDLAPADMHDPMEDTAVMVACHGDLDLLAAMPIARSEWWGFGDDRLIKHQQDRMPTPPEPPFEPPFA